MALVMVMVIVAVTVVLGYAMLSSASLQAQVGSNLQRTAAAECLAEAGVELAIYYLQNPGNVPPSWVPAGSSGQGKPVFVASCVTFGKRQDTSDVDGSVDFSATPDTSVAGRYLISATGHARPGTASQYDHKSSVVVTMTTAHLGVGANGPVTLKNNAYTDSFYINSLSPWDAAFGRKGGTVVTNGAISLTNKDKINGDATPGIGKTATGGTVTGSRTPLTVAVSYPDVNAGTANLINDNAQFSATYYNALTGNFTILANQTADFLGGTYYFNDFTMADDAKLAIHNPVTIYVKNQLTIKGGFTLPYNLAAMVKFRVISNKPVSVSGGALFYMDLYAPKSDVTITKSHVYGSVVGGTLTLDGGAIHWDEGLESAGTSQVGTMRILSYTP